MLRELVSETALDAGKLILPIFVDARSSKVEDIVGMPGVSRYPIDRLADKLAESVELGIKNFIFFGIPETKDSTGSGAWHESGVVQRALAEARKSFGERITLFADTCLCEYTSHGHCGVVKGDNIDNDETLKLLARTAVSQARAGADAVAPSAMMDGQVLVIRNALDQEGFKETLVMSYSSKFASSLYAPFRNAAESAPKFGNRRTYQMDVRNRREALREIRIDESEGADIVMVKPALPNLDIITEARGFTDLPIAAYQVSGEYTMVKSAAAMDYLDEKAVMLETLISIKRAGADIIITYFADDFARLTD